MSDAIQVLLHEHEIIRRVLSSFENALAGVASGARLERDVVRGYVEFFIRFGDAFHHAKEEEILFIMLAERGLVSSVGAAASMSAEHAQCRAYVSALHAVASTSGDFTREERAKLLENGNAYIAFLRGHLTREDEEVFPLARQSLNAHELTAMAEEFERFELDFAAGNEDLHAKASELVVLYPPFVAARSWEREGRGEIFSSKIQ